MSDSPEKAVISHPDLSEPQTDQHPALVFLKLLGHSPASTFNVECYTDTSPGREKVRPDPLASRHANLTLEQVGTLLPMLQTRNAKGAGIFVAVNQFEGHRCKENLKRVRCIHGDFDGISSEQLASIKAALMPTIIVQSSTTDRLQMYWLLAEGETLDAATAEAINRRLVDYGADPAAVDVARLLRLPGFHHMKYRADGLTPMVTMLEVHHA